MHYEIWIHEKNETGWFPIIAKTRKDLNNWLSKLESDENVDIGEIDKVTIEGRKIVNVL